MKETLNQLIELQEIDCRLFEINELKGESLEKANKQYLKAYSYARLMKIELWAMQLTFIKMTNNALGFGKKIVWRCT